MAGGGVGEQAGAAAQEGVSAVGPTTEREIAHLRRRLQAANSAYERADAERQTLAEEFNVTTEQLQTSREEVQATNEELRVLNQELAQKLEETARARDDLENLIEAAAVATLFLDRNLRIRRYTPEVAGLVNVQPGDRGRPIGDLTHHLAYDTLEADARQVLQTLAPLTREVEARLDGESEWFLVRLRPYRTEADQIEGVVVIFVEITELKRTEAALRARERELAALNETLEARVQQRTQEVRELATQLTLAEQKERDRVARILHDDLQQQLYALQLELSLLESAHQMEDDAAFETQLAEMRDELLDALATTRRLNVDLSPAILHDEGLTEAIGWLAAQMEEQHRLAVTVEAEGSFPVPDEGLRVLLFQAVRELLFNVVKHAGTLQAEVRLQREGDRVCITVHDNGRGFDRETILGSAPRGSGLTNIRHRLSLVGGKLEIESVPGDGTRVIITAPLRVDSE